MAEITRKSVLLECLSIMREEQRICSKGYNSLEPAKGMEEAWEQGRRKIQILQEIIQALDSEPVLRALANWQKEELPPRQLTIEEGTSDGRVLDREDGTVFGGYLDVKDDMKLEPVFMQYVAPVNREAWLEGDWEKAGLDNADGTMELRST